MASSGESIALSDMLTVGTVPAGCAALLAALDQHDGISIDVSPQAPVDVAGIQLLESACLYAAVKGKRIALNAPAAGQLRELLDVGGFIAGATRAQRAFWLHEEV